MTATVLIVGGGFLSFWFGYVLGAVMQADYEQRILSALSTSPATEPSVEAELVALLTEVRDKGPIYWEPRTGRGYERKSDMLARIDAVLAAYRQATGGRDAS